VPLEEYRRKRRFEDTPEPPGAVGAAAGHPRFVVQEHHARRVHWDLRLEMEGVYRSWAVPKGPSLDPADKRLAVLVEDHPLDYGSFEGIIPPGNYGAGTVMLWDRGTYECREGDPAQAFRAGKMTLDLAGEKLRGEFHFVRTRRNEGRDWLLFKGQDEYAVPGFLPPGMRSVATGRTIDDIRADRGARWTPSPHLVAAPALHSADRASNPLAARASRGAPIPRRRRGTDPFPEPFRPMLAQSAAHPFARPGWLFEAKWDGVRALGFVRRRGAEQEVVLYSRTLRRLNAQFPEIVDALAQVGEDGVVLDGEIIAPDDNGRPSFHRLQQRLQRGEESAAASIAVAYAVFDCLYLEGRDMRSRPLSERRRVLDALLLPPGMIRSDAIPQDGLTLFAAVRDHGLEGIIAKKAGSPYRPGVRSPDWLKIKVRHTLDAVVGGFTRGKGHRSSSFGALVLGQHDPQTGTLVHIGQTGGGFTDAEVRLLRALLEPLVTRTCPFARRPQTLTPATWVRPEVVVEVEYGEYTPDGVLRFPVFLRVRDDVPPREVLLAARTEADEPAHLDPPTPPARGPSPRVRRPRGRRQALPADLVFTNVDKVFFPGLGLTKGDVIEYYRRISPYILPHLLDRPLSLRRWPDGIDGEDFFQKDVPDAPPFVRTVPIWSDQGDRNIRTVVGTDEAALLWLAQRGCIETHPWFSRITPIRGRGPHRPITTFDGSEDVIDRSTLNYPDFVVFDIDPFIFPEGGGPVRRHGEQDPDYTRRGFEAARQAALWLHDALDDLGLRAFVKTSGKTGLHVFLPIERMYTYAQTHAYAKTMAEWLVSHHPKELTTVWAVRERVGKVFLDYNQNVRGKTLASIYSLRPVPEATVSVPVTWAEVRTGFDPMGWTIVTVFDRLARTGDVWKEILATSQRLETPGPGRAAGKERRGKPGS
jgi:bifunctional non-homologous end joining protein LigD